jgi:lysophospholipase L1-like esterase
MRTLIVAFGLFCGLVLSHGAEEFAPHHLKFEPAIAAFEARDATNPPPKNAVLFVGSSSIRLWTNAAAAFPGHTIINRGFGGSHMADANAFFSRIVTPHQPRVIVLYEGDNDIASGKSPEQVLADFKEFDAKVKQDVPGARLVFISIKPSPSRLKHLASMSEANRLIREVIEQDPRWTYLDVATPMLNAVGQPREELFRSDRLHLNEQGYALWEEALRPVLDGLR